MFDAKGKQRVRLALFVGFLLIGLITAFTSIAELSGWLFALSLFYLHLNTEHS